MTKEDMQFLAVLLDEKFKPINERLDKMQEDISELKEDMNDAVGKINMISEWCEAATEYHIHEIHYPLNSDEKVR